MPIALILIGAILIIVAFNNSMGQLATQLQSDVPGFFIWAVAIAIILGLGYVPGLKTPSRWLLALVVLVIVLTQYRKIISGFTTFAASGGKTTGAAAPDPATAFAASPTGPLPTGAEVAGNAGGGPTLGAGRASAGAGATGSGDGSIVGTAGNIIGTAQGAAGAVSSAASILNFENPMSYVGAIEAGFGGLTDFVGGLL